MKFPRITIVLLILLLVHSGADSQEPESIPQAVRLTDSGNRAIYRPQFFDFESAANLEQLLEQIPDLRLALDDSLQQTEFRVLINGNEVGRAPRDLRAIGRQFSMSDIRRIVILRGPAALEYQGIAGPAINIKLRADADHSLGRWEASALLGYSDRMAPNFRVNYSDRPGALSYELFAALLPNDVYRPRVQHETYLDPGGLQPTRQRRTSFDEVISQYILGGSLNWEVSGRLNLQANTRLSDRRLDRLQQRWTDDDGTPDLTDLEDDRSMTEIGFGASFRLTGASQWETLLTRISEQRDRLVETRDENEDVLRIAAATRHEDDRLVLSSAINTLMVNGSEASLALYSRRRDRDALSAVSLDPLQLATDAEISESRSGFATHFNWQSHRDIKLFAGLDVEYWRLQQQNGPFSRDDNEVFLKPALDFDWQFARGSLFRFSTRRQVRSINLDHLVFNFDLEDETVDTGNLNLVPEKTWQTSAFVERRVWNKQGKIRLGVFYRDIEDRIERVPSPGGGSGPGNIGVGYARGLQLSGRLDLFEDTDNPMYIKADLTYQESSVTDPFTGENRRLRNVPDRIGGLELRQDFFRHSLDYVFDITWRSDRWFSDHNYREVRSLERPVANFKARYQATDNLQLWLEIRGILDLDESRLRERYKDDRTLGNISGYEQSIFREARQFSFGLLGYF